MNTSWIWGTGNAWGLGQHLTTELLHKGFSVLATDIKLENLESSAEEHHWPDKRVKIAALDITQESQWLEIYQKHIDEGVIFSHLLNVAGYIEPHNGYDNTPQHVKKHINVMGIVNGCFTLIPHFKQSVAEKADRNYFAAITCLADKNNINSFKLYFATQSLFS